MTTMTVHFVHEPPREALPAGVGVSGPALYDRFVNELEHHAGIQISRVHGLLRDVAPPNGIVLFDGSADVEIALGECSPGVRADLQARIIPIGATRVRILDNLLEPLSLLAAIDGLSFWEWDTDEPGTKGARGLYGLRELGASVGARCAVFESARYCYLQSEAHDGLPHLLADYLRAAWAARS